MAGFRASQAASWLKAESQFQRIGAREHVQGQGFGHAVTVLGPAAQLVFKFVDITDPVHDPFGAHLSEVLDQLYRSSAARRIEHGHPGPAGEAAFG